MDSFFLRLTFLLLVGVLGCKPNKDAQKPMPDTNQQTITTLNAEDESQLNKQRAVVERYLRDEDRQKFQTPAGKLGLIRALLAGKVFKPDETYKLQCLGIVLGDAFVKQLNMEWIMVEDERGRNPAIRLPGTSIILFPLTMISKRIERGEEVDVFYLFNAAASKVEEMRKKGV